LKIGGSIIQNLKTTIKIHEIAPANDRAIDCDFLFHIAERQLLPLAGQKNL
jgi:hypothetical protein